MPTVSIKDLGEDDAEMIEEYQSAKLGKPTEMQFPEEYDLVEKLSLPEVGIHYIEYLPAGILLGIEWRLDDCKYDSGLVARAAAFQRCLSSALPVRVLLYTKKGPWVACVFFKRDNKVFIAARISETQMIEQEVIHQVDETGGDMIVKEAANNERDLGKDSPLIGLGYQA